MRRIHGLAFVVAAVLVAPRVSVAQDAAKSVAGGGITVSGWMGAIDPTPGQTISDAKLSGQANDLHVTTGPAVAYWNPANTASGNYTVKATFTEPKFQNLMTHPHPYGIMIGGNDLGTDKASYLYCAAYGTGTFIVRGFGPAPFQVTAAGVSSGARAARPEANAAIHKAAAIGETVTQEIALSVNGDKVECAINGTVVGSYDKSKLVGAGLLKSTDGVYGIRFAHNTEGVVTGLTMTKK
jgi:hypothetical protein